eukprot:TRINITY_DN3245_c0_g1_i1.p1 TRINITY_DN3245_c0_g1~~TRINITY_DN3245_c0_g1_i1.p1  ORF type:complete len:519 (+),score=67.25 TRINITY_DN3245_c0_g1_i1:38-1594(+)
MLHRVILSKVSSRKPPSLFPSCQVRYQSNGSNIDYLSRKSLSAFSLYRELPKKVISKFLLTVADNLESERPLVVKTAHEESHLPDARCQGELTRTTDQIKLFANLVEDGSWVDARIDPDIRSLFVPIGPVAVFGASNFPLAFSTLGGDTVSALAAGCTVIYKSHPAHPKTTLICNDAIQKAIKTNNLPDGVFQITDPTPNSITQELVEHPLIEGVGFTGSRKIGTLIARLAANRNRPIPAYCEMGSVNPIFIFRDALSSNQTNIAKGLANSVTLGVGQFCTNPGLVFVLGSRNQIEHFVSSVVQEISIIPPAQMLTTDIYHHYTSAVESLSTNKVLKTEHYKPTKDLEASPALFSVSLKDFENNLNTLQDEVFGPSTIIVKVADEDRDHPFIELLHRMEGQLTASFHATEKDTTHSDFKAIMPILSQKVGRMIWNAFPTGVAVNHSMQHGGPWPASSDGGRTTSVGTRAIYRWVRPLAYQAFPDHLLPPQLRATSLPQIDHKINGKNQLAQQNLNTNT